MAQGVRHLRETHPRGGRQNKLVPMQQLLWAGSGGWGQIPRASEVRFPRGVSAIPWSCLSLPQWAQIRAQCPLACRWASGRKHLAQLVAEEGGTRGKRDCKVSEDPEMSPPHRV